MRRRTVLQVIAAFFTSLVGWFGFGRENTFELVKLKHPQGLVSPKAQWFLSPTNETIPELNSDHAQELVTAIKEGLATFPPPTHSKKGSPHEPFVFKAHPEYELEPQGGVEVMRLRNPAVRGGVLGADVGKTPEGYVTPKGPVAQASAVWQPLERFQPVVTHPKLTPTGVVLGTMRTSARHAPVNISDDAMLRTIVQEKLFEVPEPLSAEVQAKINANFEELLARWDQPANDDRASS
jgi:hypothetical protein